MHLLEPRRLIADEGVTGAMRCAWNLARDKDSRHRVKQMRSVFRKYREYLLATAIILEKCIPPAGAPNKYPHERLSSAGR